VSSSSPLHHRIFIHLPLFRVRTHARALSPSPSLYIRSEAIKRFQQATKGGLAQNPGDVVAVAALREEEDAEMGVEYDY